MPFSKKTVLTLLTSAFFLQLVLFSVFVRQQVPTNENISFTSCASRIRLPDCSKFAKNWKNDNSVTICRHDIIIRFFWRCFVFLVKLSYWSRFHVNIITGSGVMAVFFYRGLTRNPETEYKPVWVFRNIWRQGRVRDMKFGTNASYGFYRFWVVKGKPTGRLKLLPPRPAHPD